MHIRMKSANAIAIRIRQKNTSERKRKERFIVLTTSNKKEIVYKWAWFKTQVKMKGKGKTSYCFLEVFNLYYVFWRCSCTNNFNICFIHIVFNLLPLISSLSIRLIDMPLEAHVTNLTSICSRFSADQLAAPQTFGVSFTDQLAAPQTFGVSFTDQLAAPQPFGVSFTDQLAATQTFGVSFTDQLAAPHTFGVSFTDLLFTHVGLAYMFLCIREILFPTVCLFILEDEIKQWQWFLKLKQVGDIFHVS